LTFDDGPDPRGTPAVLDALADANATATFFLVGEQVDSYPSLANEIAAAGHEIALHGYHHRLQLRRSPRSLALDLDRSLESVRNATGREPRLYRPPYGVFSTVGLQLVRRRSWRPFLWSKWGCDWRASANASSVARLATRGLGAGDVVLLHDADHYSSRGSWIATAGAVPRIAEAAAELGLPLVAVSQAT
jgi:peptidoglycan/xylan/chitin deacetylase (PgdA/CDA1 family)